MAFYKTLIFIALFLVGVSAYSQQRIPLYNGAVPNAKAVPGLTDSMMVFRSGEIEIQFVTRVATPELTIYLPAKQKATGAAVVICPGGGYSGLAVGHEGEWVAKRLNEAGIAGIVLKYRLPNPAHVENKEIVPLQDAQRAIQVLRENAKKWGINPKKIGIMGSSAGGHLASTAGTHFERARIPNPHLTSLRPDFMILNYPVISFADSLTHAGSRFNLIGPEDRKQTNAPLDPEKIREFSNELWVGKDTPPTFITHAVDDEVVLVQNSLVFIAALQQNKVPVQSFFYAKGGHGFGMDNPTAEIDWMDACIKWILAGAGSMKL